MLKKIPLILISISLVLFFINPEVAFGQENKGYWPLKEKRVENLLDIIRKKPLTEANRDLFDESIYGYNSNAPRETGAVVLVKQAILRKQLNYWFKDVPKEFSKKFLKAALKIGLTIATQGSYSAYDVINQVEKFTVKKANEYVLNWFLQNEIKIGSGEASYVFTSYKGNSQKLNIQYIIEYQQTSQNQGKIIAEFYSKEPIEPPIGKNSWSGPYAVADWIDSTPWPWDQWIENEKQGDNDGKLEPFIVRVKGYVKKNIWKNFEWDKSKGDPVVEVDFDNPVPEIEDSDIILGKSRISMELDYFKKKFLKPIANKLAFSSKAIIEKIQNIKNKLADKIKSIKTYLQRISLGGAQIIKIIKQNPLENLTKQSSKTPSTGINTPTQTLATEKAKFSLKLDIAKLIRDNDKLSSLLNNIKDYKQKNVEERQNAKLDKNNREEEYPDKTADLEYIFNQVKKIQAETENIALQYQEILSKEKVNQKQEEEEAKEKKEDDDKKGKKQKEQLILCSYSDGQYPLRNKIIFNEIAWMGTTNSANDEWIELKNISNLPVDITNWQILDKSAIEGKSAAIKIVFATTTLNPDGFLLLERTDESTVPDIPADLIYTGSIGNSNEILYLFDSQCQLQDIVKANPNWPAGSNSSKRTMERKSNLGWQTSLNPGGTPKAKNSTGEIILTSAGGNAGTNNTNANRSSPSPTSQEPKITASLPATSSVDKEILVTISAQGLKENVLYDVKIAVENASSTVISEIFDSAKNDWQSSRLYLAKRLSSSSSTQSFRVRIKDKNFKGIAAVIARIRENGKSKYCQSISSIEITEAKNQPPTARFSLSVQNPEAGQKIIFNAASSSDADGQIVSYFWDFGNGDTASSTLATTSYSFATPGTFKVILTIADNNGATSSTSTLATISQPKIADHIIISNVQIKGKEYIELYNPTKQTTSTAGWYLSYYSKNSDWNNPLRKIQFPTTTIASSTYFLIGLKSYAVTSGYPEADWQISDYSINLSNEAGAIGIFNCNPKIATTSTTTLEKAIEKAKSCKIDLFSWEKEGSLGVKVVENSPFLFKNSQIEKNTFQRRKFQGKFIDSDNNSSDFETKLATFINSKGEKANIQPPEIVKDFKVATSSANIVTLSWATATDADTSPKEISYFVYYSNKENITNDNLNSTSTEISTLTTKATTTISIKRLSYDSVYYFAIRAFDGIRYSALATTSPFAVCLPKITTLQASPSTEREAIDLIWVSPAVKACTTNKCPVLFKPEHYQIRYAQKEIVENPTNDNQISWEKATDIENSLEPRGEKEVEHFIVKNLDPNKIYYFAVKSIGKNKTVSKISNIARAKPIPGFEDNSDGTITDLYTGLTWIKDGSSSSSLNGVSTTQSLALKICGGIEFAGYNDWRLPSFKELATIIDFEKQEKEGEARVYNGFTNIKPENYWTSNRKEIRSSDCLYEGLYFNLKSGKTEYANFVLGSSPHYYFLPVRKSKTAATTSNDLIDNNDGTIYDPETNLTWLGAKFAKTFAPGMGSFYYDNRMNLNEALQFASNAALCKDKSLQGTKEEKGDCSKHGGVLYDDWRLPNILEIIKISRGGKSLILPYQGNYASYLSMTKPTDEECWAAGNERDYGKLSIFGKNARANIQLVRDNF